MAIRIWLDDVRPAPDGWILVCTVQDAIGLLQKCPVDQISLDYDLGTFADQGGCPACLSVTNGQADEEDTCVCDLQGPTGMELLHWMYVQGKWPKQKPVVHSQDGKYAKAMREFIEKEFPRA